MGLGDKIKGAKVTIPEELRHERWNPQKEPIEDFLRRELEMIKARYVNRPFRGEETITMVKREIADVLIRADTDPSLYIIDVQKTHENNTHGLSIDVQPADMKQRTEAAERAASAGNIADAYTVLVEATKAVQRAATLMQPLVDLFDESSLKERAVHLLEAQINLNDRAVMAVSDLLMSAMKQATKKTKPQFEHDCEACEFLGMRKGFDFYICGKQRWVSLIARYGNDPSEYSSAPATALLNLEKDGPSVFKQEPLYDALVLARSAGKL